MAMECESQRAPNLWPIILERPPHSDFTPSHSALLGLTDRRPGILVLINDADWELEGELEYELKDRDEVVFISTLHGG
jgi:hypothetical protein